MPRSSVQEARRQKPAPLEPRITSRSPLAYTSSHAYLCVEDLVVELMVQVHLAPRRLPHHNPSTHIMSPHRLRSFAGLNRAADLLVLLLERAGVAGLVDVDASEDEGERRDDRLEVQHEAQRGGQREGVHLPQQPAQRQARVSGSGGEVGGLHVMSMESVVLRQHNVVLS